MEEGSNVDNSWYTKSTLTEILNSTTSAILKKENTSSMDLQSSLLVAAFASIILVGSVGNILVCYYFGWKRRGRWTIPDRLFLYLGIVDLLSSLLNPALYIYLEITNYSKWDFGTFGCKFLVPFGPISTTLSSFIIQIIAVDRYLVIMSPFGRKYGSRSIDYAVIAAIAFSVLLYLYYIMMLQIPSSGGTCIILDVTDKRYAIPAVLSILVQDIMLISIIVFTNFAIVRKLNQDGELTGLGRVSEERQRNNKKLFRMLLVIATVFLTLILPRDIFQLAFTFSWMSAQGITYNNALRNLNAVVKIMSTSNSCANIFIYSKMHKNFRTSVTSFIFNHLNRKAEVNEHLELNSNISSLNQARLMIIVKSSETCETRIPLSLNTHYN